MDGGFSGIGGREQTALLESARWEDYENQISQIRPHVVRVTMRPDGIVRFVFDGVVSASFLPVRAGVKGLSTYRLAWKIDMGNGCPI